MAKIDFHEKLNRSLRLLLGLRHLEIRRALAPYELTTPRLAEGWNLLMQTGMARVLGQELTLEASPRAPRVTTELGKFQRRWFPIARGVLLAHYPALGEAFFAGIVQERGAAIPFVVSMFLDRLSALEQSDGGYGPDGPRARALLAARGLTVAVQEEAARTLESWGELYGEADEEDSALRAEEAAAAKLWVFYLEWSSIASNVLTNPAHHRWLGLESRKAGKRSRRPPKTVQIVQLTALPEPTLIRPTLPKLPPQ